MRFVGFIGPSYTLQSVNVDCQRSVNLYPEVDEMNTGNEGEVASLVSTPGLNPLCTLPTAPVRGIYTDSQDQLWAVGGNVLYKVFSDWSASIVGTLNTSAGPVNFSDNGYEVVCVDGPYGYSWTINLSVNELPGSYTSTVTAGGTTTLTVNSKFQQYFTGSTSQIVVLPDVTTLAYGQGFNIVNLSSGGGITVTTSGNDTIEVVESNTQLTVTCVNTGGGSGTASWSWANPSAIASNTFGQITDPNFLGATHAAFMDGYLIFNKPDSQQWFLSPLNAVTPFNNGSSGPMVASAEAQPEDLVGHIELQEYVYLFSGKHIEIWCDSGANTFPFQRVQGAVIEIGCAAAYSIAKLQNTVYWLGQDQSGRGVVYSAQGMQPQRISTHAIESVIEGLGDLSSARAWVYSQAGHSFYCLNLPGATTTWVFDASTTLWHERAYLADGTYSRHLVDCHAFAFNTNVGGDYSSGNLYALDQTYFSDNGNPLCRERAAPHISKDMKRIFHSRFQLDVEAGVGVDGGGQGAVPQAVLQWSDDYGHSWSNEHWTSFGPIGARRTRALWRRLGQSRDRVYRVRITDPVKVTLLGAQIDITEGAN